jgi:hypothetical protein
MSPLRDYEGRIRRSTPCWVPGDALLAQQSVTPGFLPGAGGLAWGLESPGQSSTWWILLRFTEAGTGGCGEVDRVARLIARKPSPKPEIVRRVTGGMGHLAALPARVISSPLPVTFASGRSTVVILQSSL